MRDSYIDEVYVNKPPFMEASGTTFRFFGLADPYDSFVIQANAR